jgi:hypothetical protein
MKILILLFAITFNLLGQSSNFKIRQLTNVDGDARNPFISENPYSDYQPDIFFEVHENGASNIASIDYYDASKRKFSEPVYITNNSYLNVNPRCIQFPSYSDFKDFLFFQTNVTGNWQIVYKTRKDSVWSETKFVDSSSVDETDPSLLFIGPYFNIDSIRVLYQKGNSIYVATYKDSSFYAERVFEGTDSVSYTQPTGLPYFLYTAPYSSTLYIDIAAKKVTNGTAVIVYKTENDSDGVWSQEKTVIDTGECNHPKFLDINYSTSLSYENNIGGYTNIYLIQDWGSNTYSQPLNDSVNGDLTDLNTWNFYGIVDFFPEKSVYKINNIHAYRYLTDDSMFIATNKFPSVYNESGDVDTLIYTKVKKTGLATGDFQTDSGFVSVVWEDSINGHIQLFGAGLDHITGIKSNSKPTEFQLNQNYPNPFNPSTKISFYLPHNSYVKLTVYDLLGKEVKQLINNFLYSGSHEVTFDAASDGLASGVYFYRLKAGDNVSVKKMILLK